MAGIAGHTHSQVLVGFFALVFGLSWTLWVPLVILRDAVPGPLAFTLLLVGSLVPSGVAIFLAGLAGGKAALRQLLVRLVSWRVHAAWYLVLLVPTVVTVIAVTINSVAWGGPPAALGVPLVTATTMVAFSIFPGSAIGEEIGWRGYALPRMQSRGTALPVSSLACSPRCGTFRCGCAAHPRTTR